MNFPQLPTFKKGAVTFSLLLLVSAISHACSFSSVTSMQVYRYSSDSDYSYQASHLVGNQYEEFKKNYRVTWNFGDGNTGTSSQASHTYITQGKFTVTLYVWDSVASCGDSFKTTICVYHPLRNPSYTKSGDTMKLRVACKSNTIYTWQLDWTGWYPHNPAIFMTGCSIDYIYSKPGFYIPNLVAIKDVLTGCIDSPRYYEWNTTVYDFTKCGFVTEFTRQPTYQKFAEIYVSAYPFQKNASSDKAGKSEWFWGDGTNTSQSYTDLPYSEYYTHQYTAPGTYNICHVMTDSAGTCMDSTCLPYKVDSCSAKPNFTFQVTGKTVQLTNTSNTTSIEWDIQGKGKYTTQSPTVTFTTSGTYQVCLKANGSGGCSWTTCKNVVISGCDPPSKIGLTWGRWDCNVAIFNNANSGYDFYTWDFGDNSGKVTQSAPSHKYAATGSYNVKVVGHDTTGSVKCKDSSTLYIYNGCDFCGIRDSLVLDYDSTKPYEATLNNYTYNDNSSGVIHKHFWNFGDGTTSTSASPVHTYTTWGPIYLMYIAYDTLTACEDTTRFSFTIDSLGNIKRKAFILSVKYHGENTSIREGINKSLAYQVFPNPFSNKLILTGDITRSISGIVMFNTFGQEIPLVYLTKENECTITTLDEPAGGVYLLRVTAGEETVWLKVMRD